MSSRPGEESHEIALFANPGFRPCRLQGFGTRRVAVLSHAVVERNITIKFAANHHASLAFYFDDPDGKMIEVYWPTGDLCRQPQMEPLDLSQPDEVLLER